MIGRNEYKSKDEFTQILSYQLFGGNFKLVQGLIEKGVYQDGVQLVSLNSSFYGKGSPLACVLEAGHAFREDLLFKYTFLYLHSSLPKDVISYIFHKHSLQILEATYVITACTEIFKLLSTESDKLLEKHYDKNALMSFTNVLDVAVSSGSSSIVKALLQYGYEVKEGMVHDFIKKSGDLDTIILLIRENGKLNKGACFSVCRRFTDESFIREFFERLEKEFPNHGMKQKLLEEMLSEGVKYPAYKGQAISKIQTCLNLGININGNCDDATILHYAAHQGLREIIEFLLKIPKFQLDVTACGDYSWPYPKYSALSLVLQKSFESEAVTIEQEHIFKLLLNAGSNIDLAAQYLKDYPYAFLNPYRKLLDEYTKNQSYGQQVAPSDGLSK